VTAYRIHHRTTYRYGATVTASHTIAHLAPRWMPQQDVRAVTVDVTPSADHRHEHLDAFGNAVVYLSVSRPHAELVITAQSEVTRTDEPSLAGEGTPWDALAAMLADQRGPESLLARLCSLDSAFVTRSRELAGYASVSFPPGRPLPEALADLTGRIHRDFTFDAGFSDVSTPLNDVLAHRRGVCQDFAHLAIGCLRSLGLAARYVSGYIETSPPPGEPKLAGSDASHAWLAAYDPALGWLDADPTNDQVPPRAHVTVAWGRDYADVAPVRGVVFGPPGPQELVVGVDVNVL
jgi:transglutaminase-like putative cysteine protease